MENFSSYYLGFDIIGTIPGDFIVNENKFVLYCN